MTIKFQQLTTAVGGSPTVAVQALGDAMKALITSHPNWTCVDDTVVGTASYRYLAFKLPAASSGLPNDLYVVLALSVSSGMYVWSCESYNPATHVSTDVAAGTTGNLAIDANGRLPTPMTITPSGPGTPGAVGSASAPFPINGLNINFTTLYWHAGAYDDHIVIGVASSQASLALGGYEAYLGGYASLAPNAAVNDPVRVVSAPFNNATTAGGTAYVSRETVPNRSATLLYGLSVCTPNSTNYYQYETYAATLPYADTLQGGYMTSRIYVSGMVHPNTDGVHCEIRGVYSNLMISESAASRIASLAPGDTVDHNGTQWAYLGTYTFTDTGLAAA